MNVQQGTVKGEKEEEGERRMQKQKHSWEEALQALESTLYWYPNSDINI